MRAVAFGDGSFPAGHRGHQAVPRKPLIRALMERAPVLLLDEFNTSKKCPCCGADMVDLPATGGETNGEHGERLRICETTLRGTPCPLFHRFPKGLDRDDLACVNLAGCAADEAATGERTAHLRRPDNDND